jgi:carbon monoxide dehydrogenase subunit G
MRMRAQKERTMEQQEKAFERAHEAKARGEAITGLDTLERKKTAKELTWRAKWSTRRTKFDTRTRKFS